MNWKSLPRSVFLFLFLISACKPGNEKSKKTGLIYLENGGVHAGVLTDVGGRVVFFGKKGEANLLKSDPKLWEENIEDRPEISAESDWKAYNGHIVWLGPQSDWWKYQDLNTARKEDAAVWPPDPWLIYGSYSIREQSLSRVVLQSPESPVSGVKLEKEYAIDSMGNMNLIVTATNIRKEPVAWDLWMNTRVDGYSKVYVPFALQSDISVRSASQKNSDTVAYSLEGNYFHYLPSNTHEKGMQASSKAFIMPSEPWMASLNGNTCFLIEFDIYDADETHSNQAMVEIYNSSSEVVSAALTEMEYHGPYRTIMPGSSSQLRETWRIIDIPEGLEPIVFLNSLEQY